MADRRWNVARAKASLSEVVHEAARAPQVIESRGRAVAVVLGTEEYRALRALEEQAAPRQRFHEFLRLSERLREEGGGTIRLPARRPRRSPFGPGRS